MPRQKSTAPKKESPSITSGNIRKRAPKPAARKSKKVVSAARTRHLILIGPSCAGKTTIARSLCEAYPEEFNCVVSHTTRPKREGEVEGVDYFFVTREEFEKGIEEGKFFEWKKATHGEVPQYYGTCLKSNNITKSSQKINVWVLDIHGAADVAAHFNPDTPVKVLVLPNDEQVEKFREVVGGSIARDGSPEIVKVERERSERLAETINARFEARLAQELEVLEEGAEISAYIQKRRRDNVARIEQAIESKSIYDAAVEDIASMYDRIYLNSTVGGQTLDAQSVADNFLTSTFRSIYF